MTKNSGSWKNIWIPLFSTVVALAGILSGVIIQAMNRETSLDIAQYEVTFRLKQQAYATFIFNLMEAFESGVKNDHVKLSSNLNKLETRFFELEPFLSEKLRDSLWDQIQQFSAFCIKTVDTIFKSKEERNKTYDSFIWYRKNFRDRLFSELFNEYGNRTE